ncbi:hypothetical protein HZB94_01070 [Candidatus Falkowbacteria bacterium]|nr:hypothetical protein [Candidatus Falkowbacteria bacterium]
MPDSNNAPGIKTAYIGYACSSNDECGPDGECKLEAYAEDRFGDTSGQDKADACRENYFQYKHTYTCAGDSDNHWDSAKGACAFKVGVQVRDNWGWCNGDNGGAGEYESNCEQNPKAYEFYDGYIYVAP